MLQIRRRTHGRDRPDARPEQSPCPAGDIHTRFEPDGERGADQGHRDRPGEEVLPPLRAARSTANHLIFRSSRANALTEKRKNTRLAHAGRLNEPGCYALTNSQNSTFYLARTKNIPPHIQKFSITSTTPISTFFELLCLPFRNRLLYKSIHRGSSETLRPATAALGRSGHSYSQCSLSATCSSYDDGYWHETGFFFLLQARPSGSTVAPEPPILPGKMLLCDCPAPDIS